MHRYALLPLTLLLLCAGCGEPPPTPADADLVRLASWMTGSFSSGAQAEGDSDYLPIDLHMARIWPARHDAIWLYVEQAMTGYGEAPYRQRVYRITAAGGGKFLSAVYELPDPKAWIGAWRANFERPDVEPEMLKEREGCTVHLVLGPDGSFAGSTQGDACSSTLHGAKYATSEVFVYEDHVDSWDRGFDAEGEQIWGAEQGAYVFRKTADLPLGAVDVR